MLCNQSINSLYRASKPGPCRDLHYFDPDVTLVKGIEQRESFEMVTDSFFLMLNLAEYTDEEIATSPALTQVG